MRSSPAPVPRALGATALGAVVALGLLAAPATAFAAAPSPADSSPLTDATALSAPADASGSGAVEALARDLGLSPSDARDLLRDQEEAALLDAEAAEAAGDAYAGSFLDGGALTVLVADPDAAEAVRGTGARVRMVPRSAEELAAVVSALDAAEPGPGVVGWHPDPAEGAVVVETVDGASAEAEALVGEAGVDPAAVRVREGAETAVPYAEVIGGRLFRLVGGGVCTIGFSAVSSSGQPGFLTAGHCGAAGTAVESIPAGATGVVQNSVFPGRDGAFVHVGPEWTLTNLVSNQGGGFVGITGSQNAPVGASVCVSSPYSGWRCGVVQARNQTVNYPEGAVHGLARTTVCTGPGDSGAPFVAGSQAQGITSGGSGNCASGGVTFFQEVNPLLSTWGMQLVTS